MISVRGSVMPVSKPASLQVRSAEVPDIEFKRTTPFALYGIRPVHQGKRQQRQLGNYRLNRLMVRYLILVHETSASIVFPSWVPFPIDSTLRSTAVATYTCFPRSIPHSPLLSVPTLPSRGRLARRCGYFLLLEEDRRRGSQSGLNG
jgi:hypothetical protein